MRGPRNSIESHPQKDWIVSMLLDRKPVREIALRVTPSVSHMAIERYRVKVVKPTLRDAVKISEALAKIEPTVNKVDTGERSTMTPNRVTEVALAAQPLLNRIARHQATIDAEIGAAAGDGKTVAALINADYKGMDLQGKLTGAIDAQPGVTLNVAQMLVLPRNEAPAAIPGEVIDVEAERS